MALTHFPSEIVAAQNSYYGTLTGAYLILTSGSDYDAASATMASIIKEEVIQGTGYQRKMFVYSDAVWDATQLRSEAPQISISQVAAGGIIQYDRLVLIRNASATANRSVLSINVTTNKLNFALDTAHGLVANDKVIVTADDTGTVPSGLPLQILYVVSPVDTSSERSIQLSLTNGGSAIDFSGGTLPIRVRYANGSLVAFEPFSSSTTVADGATQPITLNINWGNGTSDVNAV